MTICPNCKAINGDTDYCVVCKKPIYQERNYAKCSDESIDELMSFLGIKPEKKQ